MILCDIVFEWISPEDPQQRVAEILAKFEHDARSEKIPHQRQRLLG